MKIKTKIVILSSLLLLTGCTSSNEESIAAMETITSGNEVSETVTEPSWEPTESDIEIAKWFEESINDIEEFPDVQDYQYYARAIGKDKDYLLDHEMWEIYYNTEIINRNKDIENTDVYLIRLNPYKLLEAYAENNSCTVEELCERLSVKKEQLYYNWGYDPASLNYLENHKKNTVSYSTDEQMIFGIYNNEKRDTVMSTHMLVVDHNEDVVMYNSEVSEQMQIYRRDTLKAYSEVSLYSEFTDEEKQPAFKINGIGIRTVIPLTIKSAYVNACETGAGDENITVMLNYSPFVYGCTDADKIDLNEIYTYLSK